MASGRQHIFSLGNNVDREGIRVHHHKGLVIPIGRLWAGTIHKGSPFFAPLTYVFFLLASSMLTNGSTGFIIGTGLDSNRDRRSGESAQFGESRGLRCSSSATLAPLKYAEAKASRPWRRGGGG